MKKLISNIFWLFNNFKFIIPLILFLTIISSLVSFLYVFLATISKNIVDCAINKNSTGLYKFLIIFILMYLFNIFLSPVISWLKTYISTKVSNTLQKKVYTHIIYSDYCEISKYHSMDIITRLNNDVSSISTVISTSLPNIISLLVTIVSAFITLFSLSKTAALSFIIIVPIFLLTGKIYGKKQQKSYLEIQEQQVKYTSFLQESISNLMISKVFCNEKKHIDKLNILQNKNLKLALKRTKINSIGNLFISLGGSIGYMISFSLSIVGVLNGTLSFGSFTAILQLYSQVQSPLLSLSSYFPQFISAIAAIDRIIEIENIALEERKDTNEFLSSPKGSIKFENIDFSYSQDKNILKDLSFAISPGEIVAITGGSGKGKTTLFKLLLKLIKPTKGKIYINDESLNINHRNLISYVPQGNTLFSGTIKSNISYSNSNADFDEILSASKLASSYEFITQLENGFDTKIGEKSLGISEGQAQRICIARALIKKAPILLLDEATASLDMDTEISILKELRNLDYKPTILIITHRPAALDICDRVINLDKIKLDNKKIS